MKFRSAFRNQLWRPLVELWFNNNMQRIFRGLFAPASLFVVVQAGVGFLNYLYQVMAGRFLSLVEFGAWSIWLAQFATSLLVAIWIQSLATLGGPESPFFHETLKKKWIFPLLLVLFLGSLAAVSSESSVLALGMGWLWAVLQAVYFGRSLATGALRLISVAMAAAAVAKLFIPALPLLRGQDPTGAFYAGVLYSPAVAVLICVLFGSFATSGRPPSSLDKTDSRRAQLVLSSLILAVITAGAPQLDLLVAGHILDPVEAGLFARVALVYKGFFFLVLIFAQLLLSRQVQNEHRGPSSRQMLLIPASALMLAVILVLSFPEAWAPPQWVAFGTFHIGTLTFLFLRSQMELAHRRWGLGLCVVLLGVGEALLAGSLGLPLVQYYILALGLEWSLILGLEMRSELGRKHLA